ncbi:hypothetical protein CYMTET_25650 [Cymbomonas tetramitiformis]|uniref:Peptidase M3A/M3B catalytic domain-containing protein n=1 Tax=Cymbomonas tetramitiformis TaxID=36881 RepID=A0AAE0FU49_9CHLO|nr:hypothetical protein CYMTET_25650 [Cymbomonas tetramitiformis]
MYHGWLFTPGWVRPQADKELQLLQSYKRRHLGLPPSSAAPSIRGWDRNFYSALAKREECGLDTRKLASYLPLASCLRGLSLIVERLYGIHLREVDLEPVRALFSLTLAPPAPPSLGSPHLEVR